MAAPQLLDWPADRPLHLSGPPGSLRFPVSMAQTADMLLAQQAIALINVRAASGAALNARSLTLGLGAGPGDIAKGKANLRLDPATPPGRYTGGIEIGGVTRLIEIDVVEQVKLSIRPLPLVFDRAKGPIQTFAIMFENKGNVPLMIDVGGPYPLGLERPITTAHEMHGEGSALDQLTELFSGLIGARGRAALSEVGKIELSMPEGPLMLTPGSAGTGSIEIKVPVGLSATGRFRAYVPVYIADLEIAVLTAAKQQPTSKAKLRTKGAAS